MSHDLSMDRLIILLGCLVSVVTHSDAVCRMNRRLIGLRIVVKKCLYHLNADGV